MTTNALVHVGRNRAFALKYLVPAINLVKRNWKGIMGQAGTAGGALYIESVLDDDETKAQIEQQIGHELTDDEAEYGLQTYKDFADDVLSDDVFTPFSKRLNEFIEPTHFVIDIHSQKAWFTNNYISPNYVKAMKRNTVSRSSNYRRKR